MAQHRIFERNSVGTEDAASSAGDVERHPCVGPLAHRNLFRLDPAFVLELTQPEGEQVALLDLGCHVGQFGLGQLEGGDRRAELLARHRVIERRLEAGAGCTDHAPDDPVASLIQAAERPLQGLDLR